MKQLTIISGKGGTGKTTVTASFAALAGNPVMVDGDVDAADLHLILSPSIKKKTEFYGGRIPRLDKDKCNDCGLCIEHCRFGAIDNDIAIDPVSCEGCGVCAHVCPQQAIRMEEKLCGNWFISDTRFGPLVYARLGIAEENSGKLVTLVRQQARVIAEREKREIIIIDGPPGIGCPVIAAISGVDLVLAVTEPTLAGIHDLERILGLAGHFGIPALVCINKYDINEENSRRIKEYCQQNMTEVIGEIPYDLSVTEAMVNGKSVVEHGSEALGGRLRSLWERAEQSLTGGKP